MPLSAGGAAPGRTDNPQGLCSELHNVLLIKEYMNAKFHLPRTSQGIKTMGEGEVKDKRLRARERVKGSGFLWRPHRFGRTSEGQVKVMKTGD